MRGLTILLVDADGERLHAALSFAAACAASGGRARIHLHEMAVALLGEPLAAPEDTRRTSAGLPTLSEIFEEALGLGAQISICQSGLSLAGLSMEQIDSRVEASGPVALFGSLGDDRLLSL